MADNSGSNTIITVGTGTGLVCNLHVTGSRYQEVAVLNTPMSPSWIRHSPVLPIALSLTVGYVVDPR